MIGTSGWYYDEWIGSFYDSKKGMFTRYSKVFNTTEVNSTFYRYPSARMVRGWYRTAPPGFVFALKLPQVVTHDKWLCLGEGVRTTPIGSLELIRPLAEKLGPILIQLRPAFNYDDHAGDLERTWRPCPATMSGRSSSGTNRGCAPRPTRSWRRTTPPTPSSTNLCCPRRPT